jgi:two-component system chemotaxis response regulator CheY
MNVLLVDDSRVMRQLVRRTLRHAGFAFERVEEAGDGQEALKVLSSFSPDLVLSDWNMPNMGGFELLQTMRSQGMKTPLGFVTSESTPEMRAKATGAGAKFLLTKPFTPENVRMAMSEAGFAPTSAIKASDGPTIAQGASRTFDEKTLGELISQLASRPVTLKPGPRLVRAAVPCVTARWVDDSGQLLYAGFAEIALAASLGAALGMRPPSSVAQLQVVGRRRHVDVPWQQQLPALGHVDCLRQQAVEALYKAPHEGLRQVLRDNDGGALCGQA